METTKSSNSTYQSKPFINFSLAKFQLVSCNLSLAMIWQMIYRILTNCQNWRSLLSSQIWLMGSHPGFRNSGRVLDWKEASSIIRAHLFWTLKISFNNPTLQLPQTETKYSRTGLTLALAKMMTGRKVLMRARRTTRFKSFFLRLATWDDQDREGRYLVPRDVPLEFGPTAYHPNTAKGHILRSGKAFVEY